MSPRADLGNSKRAVLGHEDLGHEITKETFSQGPYYYTKNPTNWCLFFLLLGFSMVNNLFFVFLSSIIYILITEFYFLKKQDFILTEKYGAPYLEYKKSVRFF